MDVIGGLKKIFWLDGKVAEQSSTDAAVRADEQSVEPPMAVASAKRAHEPSGDPRGSKRVKQRASEEAENLIANYTKHPDAKPILVPENTYDRRKEYDYERDWSGRPSVKEASPLRRMAAGRRAGVRPINTLDNNAPQAAKGQTIYSGYSDRHPRTGRPSQPNGRAQTGRARNGMPPSSSTLEREDDPIQDDVQSQQAARKKRKVDGGNPSSPVDLTAEEDGHPRAIGREKDDRGGSGGSQVSLSKKQRNMTPWAPTEQKTVDSFVHVKSGANFRMTDVLSAPPVTTKKNPINVDDDDPPKANGNSAVSISPRAKAGTTQVPSINLTQGYDEVSKQVFRRQEMRKPPKQPYKQPRAYGEADIKGVNDLLSSAVTVKKPKPVKSSRPAPSAQRSREQGHDTNDSNFYNYPDLSPPRSVPPEPASLKKKFVRDDMDTLVPKRRTATQRMQTSNQTGQTLDDDSCDELEGPSTIAKSISRQVSPVRRSPAPSQPIYRPLRQFSPSNIRPSKFTGSKANGLQLASDCRPETSDVESLQDPTDGELRIRINAIYCKAICSDDGLELVWDDSLSEFLVLSRRQQKRSPRTKKPITISQADVKDWFYSKGYTGACIKGPASEISNGTILIAFRTEEDLNECFNTLFSDAMNPKPLAREHMNKLFEKQREEQSIAHDKEEDSVRKGAVVPNQKLVRRPQAPQRPQEDDEQIVYEDDPPPPNLLRRRARAHERMHNDEADTLAHALTNDSYQDPRQKHQDDTTSRYFGNGGERRSTRQVKAVEYKERAPSPVKWTKIHKPEPWAHPVLYPPEGAKRVTVDFNDLERLDEEEWLNDNLINYELKHIENEMAPEHREKVHFFNTYFFTSVSTNGSRRAFNYDAVKRWTKNIDIFTIPYLVVPISENLHWFVIVICNLPNLPRKFADVEEEEKMEEPASDGVADREAPEIVDGTPLPETDDFQDEQAGGKTADKAPSSPANEAHGGNNNEKSTGEHEAADDATAVPAGEPSTFGEDRKIVKDDLPQTGRPSTATSKKTKKKVPAPRIYDPDRPVLIALDSFGHPRSAEMRFLKQWIAAEAADKREMEVDWKELPGMNAKDLPAQLNFSDCGVFLAGYVHAFAQDPQKFVTKTLLKELKQEDLFADFDAAKKRDDMRERLLRLHDQQQSERAARKKANAAAKNGVTPQALNVADASRNAAAKAHPPPPNSSPAQAPPAAAKSSPASPSKDDHNRTSTINVTAAAQIQQEMSGATAASEDDLEYSRPFAVGEKADRDESSGPTPSSDRRPVDNDEDSEMLDGGYEPGAEERQGGLFRFPPNYFSQGPSTDLFTPDLPDAPAHSSCTPNRLLDDLQSMLDSEHKQEGGTNTIINIEDDEEPWQQLEPVIPDSQENENPRAVEKKEKDNTPEF